MAEVKDTTIRNLKPKEKAYTFPVDKGLSLLVKPSGNKIWEFRYKSPTLFKRRKTSFGSYPDIKLKIAKERAAKSRELVADRIDPIDYYRKEKNEQKKYATTKGYCDFNVVSNIHKASIISKHTKKHYAKITTLATEC